MMLLIINKRFTRNTGTAIRGICSLSLVAVILSSSFAQHYSNELIELDHHVPLFNCLGVYIYYLFDMHVRTG